MKTALIALATTLIAATGLAQAAQDAPLTTVTVQSQPAVAKASRHGYSMDCTPPNSAAECTAFHQEIRRNFTSREIGMLFGAPTAYPEYRTSYDRTVRRFDAFARAYDEAHLTAFASR